MPITGYREAQMETYTPVKLADIEERAPACGMTREKAIAYARAAYGELAGIENDDTREVEDA
jgi:hypothetical protein